MPSTDSGKAIASRNASTHGLFARDVVLPSLGEDPAGYQQMETEWLSQIVARNLLERYYVENIATASWRLRRLHRGQAQLYARQVRDQVLEDAHVSERECRDDAEEERCIDLEMRNRLYRIRMATEQAVNELSLALLDTAALEGDSDFWEDCQKEICQNELSVTEGASSEESAGASVSAPAAAQEQGECREATASSEICQNKPAPWHRNPRRVTEYLDPDHRTRLQSGPTLAGTSRRRS